MIAADMDVLGVARHVLRMEAGSVASLSELLTEDFAAVARLIYDCKGRVVLSGIGKSAIIAQKIAATMNSTGTPALFMHAADAIHGDLGMIQDNDIVILISKSGESPEIKVLVPFVQKFGNVLVAMCGNKNAYLATHADFFLDCTVAAEACPNNLAPTSSTTCQMALGDALAVCLLEMRGFTANDFAKFHPGGALGKQLYLKVGDIAKDNERPSVSPDTPVKDVILEISEKRLGAAAVIDNGKVTGIITDGDLRRMLGKTDSISHLKARDICTAHPVVVSPELLAVKALELIRKKGISQLLVVDAGGSYVGMMHFHDLVKQGII